MSFISSWNITSMAEIQSKKQVKTLISPDEGCEYSQGVLCRECKFLECWEEIGMPRFLRDNKLERIRGMNEYGRIG